MTERRNVSTAGRQALRRVVSIDHDWGLPASSVDMLIAAVSDLSDSDLEAAYLLAYHLREAIICAQIQRARDAAGDSGGRDGTR
jgi:hypothetical protein